MVKTFQKKWLGDLSKYKPVNDSEGTKNSKQWFIRHNSLDEMFLVNKMALAGGSSMRSLEQVSTFMPPKFFERLDELLGYPNDRSHGSPIPDKQGRSRKTHYVSLAIVSWAKCVLAALQIARPSFF